MKKKLLSILNEYIDYLVSIPPINMMNHPTIVYIKSPAEKFKITEKESCLLYDYVRENHLVIQMKKDSGSTSYYNWDGSSNSKLPAIIKETSVYWIKNEEN